MMSTAPTPSTALSPSPLPLLSLEGDTEPPSPKAGKNGIAQLEKKHPWDRATTFEQHIRQLHEFDRNNDRATGRVFKSDVHFMYISFWEGEGV